MGTYQSCDFKSVDLNLNIFHLYQHKSRKLTLVFANKAIWRGLRLVQWGHSLQTSSTWEWLLVWGGLSAFKTNSSLSLPLMYSICPYADTDNMGCHGVVSSCVAGRQISHSVLVLITSCRNMLPFLYVFRIWQHNKCTSNYYTCTNGLEIAYILECMYMYTTMRIDWLPRHTWPMFKGSFLIYSFEPIDPISSAEDRTDQRKSWKSYAGQVMTFL